MHHLIRIIISIILSAVSYITVAQNTWLWAESIDRSNTWNEPFYKPYNTVDKLLSFRSDSANYCTDCSLGNLLWKGIEANKIVIYQLDKKSKLSVQKLSTVTTKLLQQLTGDGPVESINDVLAVTEIVIYRKPDTSSNTQLNRLQVEWIALQISFERDTISLYLKSKECFTYLKSNVCKWVHPLNHQVQLNIVDALIERNYVIRDFTIVSASNLKTVPNSKNNLPTLALALKNKDTHTSTGNLEINKDTLLIRLQAMYSADISSKFNRGYNKAHIVEFLLKLHAENKINGYVYHQDGYFTSMQAKDLSNHLLVETIEDGDITIKRFPTTALTQLHTLKTYTKISTTDRITNDWLILGLNKELSTAFINSYAIAFKYEDVLAALATTKLMWYSGTNQQDSMRLDDAIRKQYIDYNELTICSVYGDTISLKDQTLFHSEIYSSAPVQKLLFEYTKPLLNDFSESLTKVSVKENINQTQTYHLTYLFTSLNNTALTQNTLLIDALLDGIRSNKISVYRDATLSQLTNSESVLKKLDKTRFFRTGNAKKDSIYISKIPVEDRFIKSSDLKEFTISSNYSSTKKKPTNQGFSFGIFIPAELNPQYETDTLCYVSYNTCLQFLQKNKVYKKISPQFAALLNEPAIVSVEDFYDLILYPVTEENAAVTNDLPAFVRERIVE